MANTSSTFKQAEHKAGEMVEKGKEAAGSVAEKAKEAAGSALDVARDAAKTVGRKAEDATHTVGKGIESLGGTVRSNLPHEGVIGAAASGVASGLENTGRYLEEEGLEGMGRDVTNMIRRNPIPAVLVGIGLGFLLAKLTTSSRS
jgi:hypothetical protein